MTTNLTACWEQWVAGSCVVACSVMLLVKPHAHPLRAATYPGFVLSFSSCLQKCLSDFQGWDLHSHVFVELRACILWLKHRLGLYCAVCSHIDVQPSLPVQSSEVCCSLIEESTSLPSSRHTKGDTSRVAAQLSRACSDSLQAALPEVSYTTPAPPHGGPSLLSKGICNVCCVAVVWSLNKYSRVLKPMADSSHHETSGPLFEFATSSGEDSS